MYFFLCVYRLLKFTLFYTPSTSQFWPVILQVCTHMWKVAASAGLRALTSPLQSGGVRALLCQRLGITCPVTISPQTQGRDIWSLSGNKGMQAGDFRGYTTASWRGPFPLPGDQTATKGRWGPKRRGLHVFRSIPALTSRVQMEGCRLKANFLFCNLTLGPRGCFLFFFKEVVCFSCGVGYCGV